MNDIRFMFWRNFFIVTNYFDFLCYNEVFFIYDNVGFRLY